MIVHLPFWVLAWDTPVIKDLIREKQTEVYTSHVLGRYPGKMGNFPR